MHRLAFEAGAAGPRDQLDKKHERGPRAAEPLHHISSGARRPASREQIVDDEDPLAGRHRVLVHLERVRSVLEIVGRAHARRRQLAGFAHRREAGANPIGDGGAENEAPALYPDHEIDALILERDRETVDRGAQAGGVLEQRRDVVEEDARFGKIGDVANLGFELIHGQLTENPVSRPVGTTASTSIVSTRAAGGPCRSARSKRSSASASPSACTSTRPSGRLRTQPCTPSRAAADSVNQRKPTPCTRPEIRKRRATRTGNDISRTR